MPTLKENLVDYIEDAHAMEQNVLRMLDSMINSTRDPEIRADLEHHRTETERHEAPLRERLDELGQGTSKPKEAVLVAGAMAKSLLDRMRGDKPGRNARDGYVTEHLEIASYQLLERVAARAGDERTVEIARANRHHEEEMARKIDSNWDRFIELTLAEEGVGVS
jgi:ferritin-like metal-binding protein YciE